MNVTTILDQLVTYDIDPSGAQPHVADFLDCCWTPGWHAIYNDEWSGMWELVCPCGAMRFTVHNDAVAVADRKAAELNQARRVRCHGWGRNNAGQTLGEVLRIDGTLEPRRSRPEFVAIYEGEPVEVAEGFRRWLNASSHDLGATLGQLLNDYRGVSSYARDHEDAAQNEAILAEAIALYTNS